MQRMFFHLHECGTVTRDEEGRDLPDIESAERAAIEAAREIMCAEVARGHLCLDCHIEVVDEQGERLVFLPFADALVVTGR